MEPLRVSSKSITYNEFASLFVGPVRVSLTQDSLRNLKRSHAHFRTQLDAGEIIYGVNQWRYG
jgi:histidine ammonia-lyase